MNNGGRNSGESSPRLSPLWGEPGRPIPRITSHLSLGAAALESAMISKGEDTDIEDFGKLEISRNETKLLEELVLSSPRLSIRHTDTVTPVCPRCHKACRLSLSHVHMLHQLTFHHGSLCCFKPASRLLLPAPSCNAYATWRLLDNCPWKCV